MLLLILLGLTVVPTKTTYIAAEGVKESVPKELTIEERITAKLPAVFVKIANKESLLKTDAYNPEWHYNKQGEKLCQGSYGLIQIACIHFDDYLGNFDVDTNLQLALKIYKDRGFSAWSVCLNGSVKCIN